jgi:hypothetical protein
MNSLSETESEPEQFPTEPVVDDTSLEKKPKRNYKKKVKVVEPVDVVEEAPAKPKRVMTEEHKEKMRLAREASKARKALAQKPEPLTRQETEEPQAEPEVKQKRKYTRKPKAEVAEVAEPKVIVKEVHHHYNEPKAKKATGEKAPRKPRVKKEVAEPKQVVPSVDFV